MNRYLLDTTFPIDYLDGSDDVRQFLEAHEGAEFATTVMNYKEVAVGQRLNDTFDPRAFSAAFDWLDAIPITSEHAIPASAFEAELHGSDDHTRRGVDAATADLLMEVARLKPRPSGRGYSRQLLHNPPSIAKPDIPRQPILLIKQCR